MKTMNIECDNRNRAPAQTARKMLGLLASGILMLTCDTVLAGGWLGAGEMAAKRSAHTATALANERVLICGGTQTGVAHEGIAASELFDTRTLRWLPVPPMNQARAHHQAIRLPNGNVLVTGGAGPGGSGAGHYLSSCEIFDTASGVWMNVASMNTPSAQHRLVLLDDGRVLRVGGSGGGSGTEICEIYDPVLNTWTLTGPLAVGRHSPAVAKLGNGKVIAAGGYGFTDVVELYDPATGTWSTVGHLAAAVSAPSAVQLHDGRVFIMGGESWSGTHTHHSSVGVYVPGRGILDQLLANVGWPVAFPSTAIA